MKEQILRMLKQRNDYISGQEICEKCNVSRTAIWKVINQLKDDGYEIEAVRNKGYKLLKSPDLIGEREIKPLLETKWFGKRIMYFDSIDSTNNVIKRQAEESLEHGLLAVAEEQTAGKGRRGRVWKSPAGSGIWMSFMLTPDIAPDRASMLTIVAALAVADAIEERTGLDTKIKWPNDIVVNSHKVCGILTELSAELTHVNYVVIGIGINVNTEYFPDDIRETATSCYIELGSKEKIQRAGIIASIGKYFEKYYDEYLKSADLSGLVDVYNTKLVSAGKTVKVITNDGDRVYTCVGIDSEGLMIVKNDDGSEEKIRSGEVSVRGLYGYV